MVQNNRETQFTVRCSQELRDEVDRRARAVGQSSVEWIRRAIQERLEREESGAQLENALTEEMRELIRKGIREELDRMEKGE